MKWWVILVLCILFSLSYVSAEDVILGIGESYTRGDIRITLARIDGAYEKVVLCVNNEKQMINEDEFARFSNVSLKVEHIDKKDKNVEIDIDWIGGCSHCKCDGDCLNDNCKIGEYDEFGDPIKIDKPIENNVKVNTEVVKIVEPKKSNYILMASIPLIGILIGIILVWLFWFRQMTFQF